MTPIEESNRHAICKTILFFIEWGENRRYITGNRFQMLSVCHPLEINLGHMSHKRERITLSNDPALGSDKLKSWTDAINLIVTVAIMT